MSVINTITMIVDGIGNDVFNEVTVVGEEVSKNPPIRRGNSNTNINQIITPIDFTLTRDITFLLANGRSIEYRSLTNDGKVTVIYEGVEQEWNRYTYGIASDVLAVVSLLTSSPLYYSARFRETDEDFLGLATTTYSVLSDTDEALISAELLATPGFDNPLNGEFVTVYNASEDARTTYQYDSGTLSYQYLGFEKSQYSQIINTYQQELTIYPTVQGSDTSISASEIDIIKQWLTELQTDIDEIFEKLKQQDVDGNFDPVDDDAWSSDKRMYNYLISAYTELGLDYTFGETIHDSLTLFNASGNAVATYDGTNIVWLIQPEGTQETVSAEMFKNLFVQVQCTADINAGDFVQFDGVIGVSGKIKGKPFVPSELNTSPFLFIGVATQSGTAVGNQEVLVNWYGVVNDLDTSSLSEGDILYAKTDGVDGVDDGKWTNVAPIAPNAQIRVSAVVTSHATQGAVIVRPDFGLALSELHDVYFNGHVFTGNEIIKYDVVNSRWIIDNLDNYKLEKNGWPEDITDKISFVCDDATHTVTITASEDIDYYIQNVKYTFLASTPKSIVTPLGTSRQFFIVLDTNGDLVARTTPWEFIGIDYVWCVETYWNDTSNEYTSCAYEFHGYEMPNVVHRNNHWAVQTYLLGSGGGAVSDNGDLTVGITGYTIGDEDINMQVAGEVTHSGYKYYRLGASEIYRDDDSTSVGLIDGVLQINPFNGSIYTLEDVGVNRYCAYWVVYTTDPTAHSKIWLGQKDSDTLNNAIEENGINSMNFGAIPIEEQITAYRLILRRSGSTYTIEQIDNFLVDPQTGLPQDNTNSHGALLGLGDDDHTQYFNEARLGLTTSASKVGYDGSTGFTGKTNVQDAIDQAKTDIDSIVAGGVSDNSITNIKLGTDVKVGSNSTYQTNTGSTADDVYGAMEEIHEEVLQDKINSVPYINGIGQYEVPKNGVPINITEENSTKPFSIEGLTLAQQAPFGDKFSSLVSNVYYTQDANGDLANNTSYTSGNQNYNFVTNDWYFVRILVDSVEAIREANVILWYDNTNTQVAPATFFADDRGVYAKFQATNTAKANVTVRAGLVSDNIDNVYFMVIPIEGTILESLTASEINLRIPTYFEGLESVGAPKTYTQLLDNRYDFGNWTTAEFTVDKSTEQSGLPYQKYSADGGGVDGKVPFSWSANQQYTILTHLLKSDVASGVGYRIIGSSFGGSNTDLVAVDDKVGVYKTLITSGASPTSEIFVQLNSTESSGSMILRSAIIEGDHTNISDEEALRIIKEVDYGDFTRQGVNIKSTGLNKYNNQLNEIGSISPTTGLDDPNTTTLRNNGFVNVLPSTQYTLSSDPVNTDRVFFYDSNENYISYADGVAPFTTPSNCAKIRFRILNSDIDTLVQVELGTSATDYQAYKTTTSTVEGRLEGIGGVYDDELVQRFDRDFNDVVQSATSWAIGNILTNTHQFFKTDIGLSWALDALDSEKALIALRIGSDMYTVVSHTDITTSDIENLVSLKSSNELFSIRVNKTTYPNSASFEAYLQANDVEFIYELDEYLPRSEANNNEVPIYGEVLLGEGYTYEQSTASGVINEFSAESSYNLKSKVQILEEVNVTQGKEIKDLSTRLATAEAEIDVLESSVSDLVPVSLWSGALTVSPVESTPPTNTLDSGDFDTYNYYRILTFAPNSGKKWSNWFEFDVNGDIKWVEHVTAMTNTGASSTIKYGKFERDSSTGWHWYNGTTVTSGTPTSTSTSISIIEIQGRNV